MKIHFISPSPAVVLLHGSFLMAAKHNPSEPRNCKNNDLILNVSSEARIFLTGRRLAGFSHGGRFAISTNDPVSEGSAGENAGTDRINREGVGSWN
jgi:hypothetical protein